MPKLTILYANAKPNFSLEDTLEMTDEEYFE